MRAIFGLGIVHAACATHSHAMRSSLLTRLSGTLALLAANRIDDLKAQLEAIRKDKDHGFYTQAGDLLKKM